MAHKLLYTLLAFTCVLSVLAAPKNVLPVFSESPSAPLPPRRDPFYKAPHGYEAAHPGQVLKIRHAPGNLTKAWNASAAYNILYRTTNSDFKPAWAVTRLYVPKMPGSSLLSYQVAYDSANVDWSPSFSFYSLPNSEVARAFKSGWYLNVPDYEGPLAAFTAGVFSGHATIDSIRAVLNTGLCHNVKKTALYGCSGGALASEWAAELQMQYAPELSIAGMALGGLTPNITSVIESLNGTAFAATAVQGVLGLIAQHPDADLYVRRQLKPLGSNNESTFLAALTQTPTAALLKFAGQNIFEYFASGSAILQNSLIRELVNRDGNMGYHGVPNVPVFAFKAIEDEFSPISDTDELVKRYCEIGANILYQRNTIGGHMAEANNGADRVFAFLGALFDGSYASKFKASGCTIQNVTTGIDTRPY